MNDMTHTQHIALVDEHDNIIGYEEKLRVHQMGLLHRAFSLFVLNANNELLLQRRACEKYHSPGLWTNTCCSHGVQGEDFADSLTRRLHEEMGFTCELHWQFSFRYQVAFPNGLIENELDHVYTGHFSGSPLPDPREVAEWKWASLSDIKQDLRTNPEAYTYWFRAAFDKLNTMIIER